MALALSLGSAAVSLAFLWLGVQAKHSIQQFGRSSGNQAVVQPNTNSLPRDVVAGVLKELTGAELPTDAQAVYGLEESLFTTVMQLRFSCPEQAFRRMQITSMHLGLLMKTNSTVDLRGGNL